MSRAHPLPLNGRPSHSFGCVFGRRCVRPGTLAHHLVASLDGRPDGRLLLWRVFGKWTVHWVAPGRSPLAPLAHTATSEGGTVSKDTLLWLSHTHRKDGPSHSSGICGRVFGCRCAMRTWLLHAWTIRLAPLVHVTAFQRVDR